MTDLKKDQLDLVKKSYLNMLALFIGKEKIDSRYIRCLLKWGFQLRLTPEDLKQANIDISSIKFSHPGDKVEMLESIYHLVHMIYLDEVVEDIELEVATAYAEELGFKPYVVSELFKSIVTAAYDNKKRKNVHQEVIEFLKLHES
jgi:hypothetical protein